MRLFETCIYCGGKPEAPECFSARVHQQSGSEN